MTLIAVSQRPSRGRGRQIQPIICRIISEKALISAVYGGQHFFIHQTFARHILLFFTILISVSLDYQSLSLCPRPSADAADQRCEWPRVPYLLEMLVVCPTDSVPCSGHARSADSGKSAATDSSHAIIVCVQRHRMQPAPMTISLWPRCSINRQGQIFPCSPSRVPRIPPKMTTRRRPRCLTPCRTMEASRPRPQAPRIAGTASS